MGISRPSYPLPRVTVTNLLCTDRFSFARGSLSDEYVPECNAVVELHRPESLDWRYVQGTHIPTSSLISPVLVKNSLGDIEDIFSSAIPAVEKSYRSLLRTVIMGNDTHNEECRLFAFENVSVNGFFEGTDHDISWHNVDDEFNQFAVEQLGSSTTLVFGRVTYELMADYWPTVTDADPVAERMNSMEKVVVSTTMESADWNNTRLVSGNVVEEIRELKRGSRKDIAVLGSSNLTVSLLSAGLVDELRIMVNPILLGNGTSIFIGLSDRITLTHRSTKTFGSGNVLLSYEPSYE